MEALWKKEYMLQPFVAKDQFKSYSELKVQMNRVLAVDRPSVEDPPFDLVDLAETKSDVEKTVVSTDDDSMKLFDDLARIDE